MKKLILLSLILNLSLNGFTQRVISASNPLEQILQKDFDSTILYSYSGLKILYYLNNSGLLEAWPEGGFFPRCL